MSKIFNSIKNIFKKNGKSPLEGALESPFDSLLELSLTRGLEGMSGNQKVYPEHISFEELSAQLSRGKRYLAVNYYCELSSYLISYLYPEPFIARLDRISPAAPGKRVDYDFLEAASLRLVPAIYGGSNYFKSLQEYEEEQFEPLLLALAGNVNFRAALGGVHFYISVNSRFYHNIQGRLKDEGAYSQLRAKLEGAGRVKSRAEEAALEKRGESYLLKIGSAGEFPFSSFLFPERPFIPGGALFRPLTVTGPKRVVIEQGGTVIAVRLTLGEKKFTLFYSFEGLSSGLFEEYGLKVGDFFKALFRQIKECAGTQAGIGKVGLEYKAVSSLPSEQVERTLCLEGTLKLLGKRFKTAILCDSGLILHIASALLTPLESGYLLHWGAGFEPANRVISSLLSANGRLGPGAGGIFRESLLLSDLLSLLGDDDLKLLVQNFLIPRYSLDFIKSLFRYRFSEEGPILNLLINEKRFTKFIPPPALEEYKSRPITTGDYDRLLVNNRLFLKELLQAVRGNRLALSARGGFIVERRISRELEAGLRKMFDSLVEQDIPFRAMQELEPRELEIFIRTIGNLDYCRLFLGSEESFDHFLQYIPGKRKEIIMEDFAFIREQRKEGKIGLEQLVENRRAIHEKVKKKLEQLEREKKVIPFDPFR